MSLLRDENRDDKQDFTRRALIVGAAQGGFLAILGARLGWLQIAEGQRYSTLSEKNRVDFKMIAPQRGEIFDRHQRPLAINQQNFRILITPEQAPSPAEALKTLQKLVSLSDKEVANTLKQMKKVAKFTSIEVKDQLSWDDLAKIEVRINDLPGISTDIGTIRDYPLGEASAHLIGYVGAPTERDVSRNRLYSLPGFKIGKTGIERAYDELLRGQAGLAQMEVNVTGREVGELKREAKQDGQNLTLTIDGALQSYVQERLGAQTSGSAVVMDAHTGAIYAIASYPAFDPNLFVRGLPQDIWDGLLKTQGKPLTNKAANGLYPPASTFKMITALAGLELGIIDRHTKIKCTGHHDYKGQRFHCWKKSGHGSMDLVQALAQSCDTYFYDIAPKIGIDTISKIARMFGFEEDFSDILGEARRGIVPDKNWKMGHVGQSWKPGDTIVTSIGQGSLLSTPLQIAVMNARLVNGGYKLRPYLLKNDQSDDHAQARQLLNLRQDHLKLVLEGMNTAVNHKKGTAFASKIEDPAFAYAGKTGTAQVKRITAAQRAAGVKNEELPWESRHHALFTGHAPLNHPRYICSVIIEHGVGGSRTAAPIARDILYKAQQLKPEEPRG